MQTKKTSNMIKYFMTLLLMTFSYAPTHAQSGHATREDVSQLKTDTLLLLTDSLPTPYQSAMKEAMEKYWTYSPFRLIPEWERVNYCKPGYAFMARYHIETSRSLYYIGIVLPDNRGCNWNHMEMKVYSSISFDTEKINGHAIRAVQFMQNYLNQFSSAWKEKKTLLKACNLCNSEMKSIRQKTLLINDGDLDEDIQDSTTLSHYYKFPFKMSGREEISDAMINQDPNIAYLLNFTDDNGLTYRLVIQARESKILYCEHSLDGEIVTFSKKNFRELSK